MNEEVSKLREEQTKRLLVTPIKAEVIDVYDEEAEDKADIPFSYKYKIIHPITDEIIEVLDEIETIETGEMMYDIGDEIEVMFAERLPRPGDTRTFTVRRTPIYPEVLNNEIKKNKTIKRIFFLVIFILSILFCFFSSSGSSTQKSSISTIQTQDE